MFAFLHKYASLMHFYRLSARWSGWLALATALLMAYGLYGGLVTAPADYQQVPMLLSLASRKHS